MPSFFFRIRPFQYIHMLRITCIVFCIIIGQNFTSIMPTAYAATSITNQYPSVTCSSTAAPTSNSLLVVLLDRSGSLVEGTSPTDPKGYSTSVTKALVDLWPGLMVVIPFSNNSAPVLGPFRLSDLIQRTKLKDAIQNYPISGDTPLETAMDEALQLLQNAPPGSRAILVTDGRPEIPGDEDGSKQIHDIHTSLIPKFCNAGIPISIFGLSINDNEANQLLTDIAKGTGAAYTDIQNARELAMNVIDLYGQWLNLSFTQIQRDRYGNFPISVDAFAKEVDIVIFHSDSGYSTTLSGPDGQAVNGVQVSMPPDRHYEIESLDVSPPLVPGIYTVNVGSDPDAQVYTLISSPLQLQIAAPTSKMTLSDNQSIPIEAAIFDGSVQLTPQPGEGYVLADVTFLVNGKVIRHDIVDLKQKGNVFTGQVLAYGQAGELQVVARASYQGVKRQAHENFYIEHVPIQQNNSSIECNSPQCLLQHNGWLLFAILGFFAVLVIILVLLAQKSSRIEAK